MSGFVLNSVLANFDGINVEKQVLFENCNFNAGVGQLVLHFLKNITHPFNRPQFSIVLELVHFIVCCYVLSKKTFSGNSGFSSPGGFSPTDFLDVIFHKNSKVKTKLVIRVIFSDLKFNLY